MIVLPLKCTIFPSKSQGYHVRYECERKINMPMRTKNVLWTIFRLQDLLLKYSEIQWKYSRLLNYRDGIIRLRINWDSKILSFTCSLLMWRQNQCNNVLTKSSTTMIFFRVSLLVQKKQVISKTSLKMIKKIL